MILHRQNVESWNPAVSKSPPLSFQTLCATPPALLPRSQLKLGRRLMTDKRQSKSQLQLKYQMAQEHTSEERALLTLCWCYNIPNSLARNPRQVTNPPKQHFDT